jgi:phosphoglycerate dehydrogenase-like enzyme
LLPFCLPAAFSLRRPGSHETSTAELAVGMMGQPAPDSGHCAEPVDRNVGQQPMPAWLAAEFCWWETGAVGKAIEARLLAFETHVTRMASRERDDEQGRIHGIESLYEQLPLRDIVEVSVPLSGHPPARGRAVS